MNSISPVPVPGVAPSEAAKVLVGADGWMFLQNDANLSVEQYVGEVGLSEVEAARWQTYFTTLMALRAEFGFAAVQLFAPSKESVYEPFYPHRHRKAAVRSIDTLLALVPPELPCLYPVDLLRHVEGRPHSYDKGDHHWNGVGGALASVAALRMLGCDLPDALTLGHREVATFGDLDAKIMTEPVGTRLYAPRNPDVIVTFDSKCENHGRILIYFNPKAPDRSLLILGDSFANYIQPMLAGCFRRVVRVHGHALDRRIFEIERPDYLISEMAERFIIRAPASPNEFDLRNTMRKKFSRLAPPDRATLRADYDQALKGPEKLWAAFLLPALP